LIAVVFLFGFFAWLGAPSLQWAWSSELFPTAIRGRSQGFCNAACRLAIALNIFLVPVALSTIGFRPFLLMLSLPLFAYAFIVSRYAFFESANRSLESISE
jgi:putative MFS transporter